MYGNYAQFSLDYVVVLLLPDVHNNTQAFLEIGIIRTLTPSAFYVSVSGRARM